MYSSLQYLVLIYFIGSIMISFFDEKYLSSELFNDFIYTYIITFWIDVFLSTFILFSFSIVITKLYTLYLLHPDILYGETEGGTEVASDTSNSSSYSTSARTS